MSKSTTPTRPKPPRWWVSMDDDTAGPYTASQILSQIQLGRMDGATLACLEGSEQWRTLAEWPHFRSSLPSMAEAPENHDSDNEIEDQETVEIHDDSNGGRKVGRPLSDYGVPSRMDPEMSRLLGWGAIFLVAAIFFGAGPLKGCMPDGCRYKSDSQRRLEELQRRLNP